MLAGIIALAGPLTLTGSPVVDAVERALLVAAFSYLAAHGRRQAWLIAGGALAVVARDLSLVFVIVGLAAAVASTQWRRRPRDLGAVAVASFGLAIVWLPAGHGGRLTAPVALAVALGLAVTGFRQMRRRQRRRVARIVAAAVAVMVAAMVAAGVAGVRAAPGIDQGSRSARGALAAARRGDTERARALLAEAKQELGRADRALSGWTTPARGIPGVAQQVHGVRVAVRQAQVVSDAADDLVQIDYESLRYRGRVDLTRIEALHDPSARVEEVLSRASDRLHELDDDWLLPPLASRLDQFTRSIDEAQDDVRTARSILAVLPDLLGGRGTRRYLVVFTTPAELRGSGGFVGSYAELEAVEGKVTLTRSGRIADLIYAVPHGTRTLDAPPAYVARYGRFNPQDLLQDATMSPDWPSNAQVLAGAYPQSGGQPVDGVIGVDPKGLAALLRLTGPVMVDGLDQRLTASNAVDLLTRDQYLQFGERAAREEVLADATKATFQRLTEATLPAPRLLGDALGAATRGRHLQVWSRHPADQRLFEDLGAASALALPTGGDGFEVLQQNAGNSKIDAYLHRRFDYDVTIDAATGRLRGTLTITVENRVPSLALPPVVVGNERGAPVGTSLASVSVHTPLIVERATIDGRPVVLGHGSEAGLPVWDTAVLAVPAGGTTTIVLHVNGAVDLRDGYHLRLLPQPVANPDRIHVRVRLDGAEFETRRTRSKTVDVSAFRGLLTVDGSLAETLDLHLPVDR